MTKLFLILIAVLVLSGCCSQPVVKERIVEVITPADTVVMIIPAKHDSIPAWYIPDTVQSYYKGEVKDSTGKKKGEIKFYPTKPVFTLNINKDTIYYSLPPDTIKIPVDCPEKEIGFWDKTIWTLGGTASGIVLMVIAFLLMNNFKPEWIGNISGLFKK